MGDLTTLRDWLADIDDYAKTVPNSDDEQAKRDALARVLAVAEAAVALQECEDAVPHCDDLAATQLWDTEWQERNYALDAAVAALRGGEGE